MSSLLNLSSINFLHNSLIPLFAIISLTLKSFHVIWKLTKFFKFMKYLNIWTSELFKKYRTWSFILSMSVCAFLKRETLQNLYRNHVSHSLNIAHLSMRNACNTLGTRGDPGMTPEICGIIGDGAQVFLVWMRAPGVENDSYPWRLGVTWAMCS